MARSLSIVGFLALAIGLQWAGYGALLGAIGLILIWQGNR